MGGSRHAAEDQLSIHYTVDLTAYRIAIQLRTQANHA